MSSRKKKPAAAAVAKRRRSTRLAAAHSDQEQDQDQDQHQDQHQDEDDEQETEEKYQTKQQQKRKRKQMRARYTEADETELTEDKLLASPSESSAVKPVLSRFFHDGSLARVLASSSHILELVQNAINHSILLSKTLKARTIKVTQQDASGNSETELEQLAKTICVTKYDRYLNHGSSHVDALITIGSDPHHSIRFDIRHSYHNSECYVSFGGTSFYRSRRNATPDQYHEMMRRWGLTTTSVEEIEEFLEQLGEELELRL